MTVSTSAPNRDPSSTWVVTLKSNGMRYPNWDGDSPSSVLAQAAMTLKQPLRNLSVQLQMEWS